MALLNVLFSSKNEERTKSNSWFKKNRIYPLDFCMSNDKVTQSRITGLKLSCPFLLIIFVAIIAACV